MPYEIKHYQRDPKTMLAPPELREVHPLGKSPVITDGDAHGGRVRRDHRVPGRRATATAGCAPPPGTPERLRYTYWLHFAEGSAMPPLLLKLVFDRCKSAPMPFFVKPIARAHRRQGDDELRRPQHRAAARLHGGRARQRSTWFAGDEFTRRRRADELPARSRGAARRAGRHPAEADGLPGAHPRAAGLPARAGARRALQLRRVAAARIRCATAAAASRPAARPRRARRPTPA